MPVPVLESLLLNHDQVVALVGGADVALVTTANSTSDSSRIIDDPACLGLGSVGDVTTYSGTGWVGMRGNQYSTPGAVRADVTQLVTSFTTTADAKAMLQRTRQDWQGCATRRYGFHSSNGNHSHFDTGPLTATETRIQLSMRQTEDARWGCSHGMALHDNVIAEARVCLLDSAGSRTSTAAAVNNLLDQLVARIPQ